MPIETPSNASTNSLSFSPQTPTFSIREACQLPSLLLRQTIHITKRITARSAPRSPVGLQITSRSYSSSSILPITTTDQIEMGGPGKNRKNAPATVQEYLRAFHEHNASTALVAAIGDCVPMHGAQGSTMDEFRLYTMRNTAGQVIAKVKGTEEDIVVIGEKDEDVSVADVLRKMREKYGVD